MGLVYPAFCSGAMLTPFTIPTMNICFSKRRFVLVTVLCHWLRYDDEVPTTIFVPSILYAHLVMEMRAIETFWLIVHSVNIATETSRLLFIEDTICWSTVSSASMSITNSDRCCPTCSGRASDWSRLVKLKSFEKYIIV